MIIRFHFRVFELKYHSKNKFIVRIKMSRELKYGVHVLVRILMLS